MSIVKYFAFTVFFIIFLCECKKKANDDCGGCPSGQLCVGDKCHPAKNVYSFNGQTTILSDSAYFGVAQGACFDTIVFSESPHGFGDDRFNLWLADDYLRFVPLLMLDSSGSQMRYFAGVTPLCRNLIDDQKNYSFRYTSTGKGKADLRFYLFNNDATIILDSSLVVKVSQRQ
jgi:hypothetical protein